MTNKKKPSDAVPIRNVKLHKDMDPFRVERALRKNGYYASAMALDVVRTTAPKKKLKGYL